MSRGTNDFRWSWEQLESLEVLFRPAGLFFDYLLEGFPPKRFIAAVEGHSGSSPVRMVIDLVRAIPTIKSKPIADEAGNNLAGGEIPKQSVVEAHRSDSDCHTRFDGYLDFISGFLRNMFAVLKHALHDHMDNVINVLQRFGLRGAPS